MSISLSTPYLFEQNQSANSFTQRENFARLQDHTIAVDIVQFSSQSQRPTKLTPVVLTLDDPDDTATAAARFESLHGMLQEHFPNDLITQLKRYVDVYKADPKLAKQDYQQYKEELDEWFKTYASSEEYQQFKQSCEKSIPLEEMASFKVIKEYTPEFLLRPQLPNSPDTLVVIPNPDQNNSYLGMTLLQRYGDKDSKTGMILNACVDKP